MIGFERIAAAVGEEMASHFPDRRLEGAWLYGSHARGEPRPGSDIDIGLLCDRPLDQLALFDSSGRLAAALGAVVDLVDLRQASVLLRVEATHEGRPLIPLTLAAELFATHALADHAAFAQRRQAATEAFKEKLQG